MYILKNINDEFSTPRLIGEVITEMLLHANTPLAIAYRKRGVAEKECGSQEAYAEAVVSDELTKDAAPWKK